MVVSGAERIQASVCEALKAESRALTIKQLQAITGYDALDLYSALSRLMKEGSVEETVIQLRRSRGWRMSRPLHSTAWQLRV